VSNLIASQAVNEDNNDDNDDDEFLDIDASDDEEFTDPKPKALSTTQLGLRRLNGLSDAYLPGTLPPRLYQTNPFARQTDADEIPYELSAKEIPATAQEIQALAEEEEDEEALSQAVETMLETTRAGRKRKATSKVKANAELEKALKKAKSGSCK
jgi:uncharacterized protein YkwD